MNEKVPYIYLSIGEHPLQSRNGNVVHGKHTQISRNDAAHFVVKKKPTHNQCYGVMSPYGLQIAPGEEKGFFSRSFKT